MPTGITKMHYFLVVWMFFLVSACAFTKPIKNEKINGANVEAPRQATDDAWIADLQAANIQWMAIIPYAFSEQGKPGVNYDGVNKRWWGESFAGVTAQIEHAHSRGLKVMLKPQVWMRGGVWIGDFDLQTESDWKIWEGDYRKYLLSFARIADSTNVEMICIGTEYRMAVKKRPEFWKSLIKEIRTFYDGKLTYGANWDDYNQVAFWNELDYIGFSSYFPLSDQYEPQVEDLLKAWNPIKNELKEYSAKHKKQILFTEYGYRSMDEPAWKSWEVEWQKMKPNQQAQANAYEALFKTFWKENWVAGGFLWKWHVNDARYGGPEDSDWTPQNKLAEKVVAEWYK